MHTVADTGPLGSAPAARASASDPGSANASADPIGAATARVAVAGAAGYTGQELLRLLSRHPAVTLTSAVASGQTGAASRRLPGLSRSWNGTIVPLAPETLAAEADVVFLALPDSAAAELAPALADAGVRVIDLSGAFRIRDAEVRRRWYPETHQLPAGVAFRPTERQRGAGGRAALLAEPGRYPTPAPPAPWPPVEGRRLLPAAPLILGAQSG